MGASEPVGAPPVGTLADDRAVGVPGESGDAPPLDCCPFGDVLESLR